MIERFRAGAYSVYEMHRLCVRTNLPSVGSSVVSLKVLKLDPIFWVFKITSASKYGSCLVVRWENTEPQQKLNGLFHCNDSLKAGALMGN